MRIVIYADDGQLVTSSEFPSPLDGAEVASSVQKRAAQIRNLVIEECAVICEQYSREHGGWVARQEDAIACAALIRAAKT